MNYFKLTFCILIMLSACSTEMDSDLETAINNGDVADDSSDLPGVVYTGDDETSGGDNSSSSNSSLLYNFADGNVPSNFSMSGNASWSLTADTKAFGTNSLQSGAIVHNQTSCVSVTQTTVVGTYSFYYKTSSDSSDSLKLYLDNSTVSSWSGSSISSFTKYIGTVSTAGSHTFKWCYEKDSSSSNGSDTVWIDEILMPLETKIVSSISAGRNHSCSADNESSLACWGKGDSGQLGNGSSSSSDTAVSVSNISTATSVSAGSQHTCALLSGGTVQCWGSGDEGRLGNGSSNTRSTPVSVDNISTATSVSAGVYHTCALLSGGTVQCWGSGSSGQLGNGSSTSTQSTPVSVSGISTATSVSAGFQHTCALLSGGTVQCWGNGDNGMLGNGSSSSSNTPVTVSNISTATSVTAGRYHTCALLSGGTVQCWGNGSWGQLGNGSSTNTQSTPVSVSGISMATSVSAGSIHTCALLSGGTVQCWGYGGYGQLGNGSISDRSTPVSVSNISTATAVSAGEYHTCALLSGGTVQCWGKGNSGQLGNGSSTTRQSTPVSVEPFFRDQAAPTGSFAIQNKSSYSSGYVTISMQLTATDSTGIAAYYFSTSSSTPSSDSSSWTPVMASSSLSQSISSTNYLSSGNNNYYVWFKDLAGNVSAQYTDSMYCSSSTCY